jgi:hypothetical protein
MTPIVCSCGEEGVLVDVDGMHYINAPITLYMVRARRLSKCKKYHTEGLCQTELCLSKDEAVEAWNKHQGRGQP